MENQIHLEKMYNPIFQISLASKVFIQIRRQMLGVSNDCSDSVPIIS